MGTRSKTFFHFKSETVKDPKNTSLIMYKQYDGYPEGTGLAIAKACINKDGKELKLVNGFNNEHTQANGIGCLAATIIKNLKNGCGNVYLCEGKDKDISDLDYYYTVSPSNKNIGNIIITCYNANDNKLQFKGTPKEWIKKYN